VAGRWVIGCSPAALVVDQLEDHREACNRQPLHEHDAPMRHEAWIGSGDAPIEMHESATTKNKVGL
jgi:hypothetical protein